MKPTYLNAQQKEALTMFLACAQFLEDAVKTANRVPTENLADLKRARTYAWKGATGWLKSLDEKTKKSILNIIKDVDIGIISRQQAQEWTKMTDTYIGGREYIYRYVENVLTTKCSKCDGSPGGECPIREAHKHFDIPAWDENHPRCEYAGAGVTE